VRHVAIFGNDLKALNGFRVADYIVQIDRAVFFDPEEGLGSVRRKFRGGEGRGMGEGGEEIWGGYSFLPGEVICSTVGISFGLIECRRR
jgi:hypothetical protein